MPQAYIARDLAVVDDKTLRQIVELLQPVAAVALSVKGVGELNARDILVEVKDFGPFDRHARDLQIIILAHEYPERAHNIDERTAQIAMYLGKMIPKGVSYSIWCILGTSSYLAFEATANQ